MELLIGVLVELLASGAWAALRERFRKPPPSWAAEVASRLADWTTGLTVAEQEAVERWLQRGDVFAVLAAATPDNARDVVARVVSALEYELGAPSAATKERAAELSAAAIARLVEIVDPATAATLAGFRALKGDMTALKQGQVVILDAIEDSTRQVVSLVSTRGLDDAQLDSIPPPAAEILRDLHADADSSAVRLLDWLHNPTVISDRIRLLVTQSPDWLQVADGRAWEVVAVTADAHLLNDFAVAAFDRSASLRPSERSRLLARAAIAAARKDDDRADSADYMRRARIGASASEVLFLDVVDAALEGNREQLVPAVRAALDSNGPEPVLMRIWAAHALLQSNQPDEAIALLEPAFEPDTSNGGLLRALALAYLTRATLAQSRTRVADLRRAFDLALGARDARRRWGGDSGEPVELACQAAFLLEDFDAVERLASPVDGEATAAEASRPEIRQLLALVQSLRSVPTVTAESAFEDAWLRGLQAMHDPDRRTEAIAALTEAATLASDDRQLDRCQRALAHLGHLEIPRLDEVAERQPEHVEALRGLAEFRAGMIDAAVARLRPLAASDPFAAIVLAQVYDATERRRDAAGVLLDAGERFSDPSLTVEGCRVLLHVGRVDEAEAAALRALASAPDRVPVRRALRRVLVDVALERGDPRSVEAAAKVAIDEGDGDPGIRWTRVQALARLRRFGDGWSELKSGPSLPIETEDQALLFLQTQARAAPSATDEAVGVLDAFADSHDVVGTGLALILDIDAGVDDRPAVVEAVQGHLKRFTERYPDSPILRAVRITPDDPELLRAELRELLTGDPESEKAKRALAERTAAGKLPIGFTAAALGRGHIELLLGARAIPFTCVPGNSVVLAEEVRAATEALERRIIVDPSSLVVASFIPIVWNQVLASFVGVSLATGSFADIDESTFHRPRDGTMHWDHRADTWRMTGVSDEETEAYSSRREWIRERAAALPVLEEPAASDLADRLGEAAEHGTWAAPLLAADASAIAVLCDDVATAALARSLGIPAFGTFALLLALVETGKQSSTQIQDVVRVLFEAQADDLPLSNQQVVQLAASTGWQLGPTIHPLSRPAFWRDIRAAQDAFIAILIGMAEQADGTTPLVLHAAVLGIIRSVVGGSPLRMIGGLFAIVVFTRRVRSQAVPDLVEAVRSACDYYDLGDPLEDLVATVFDAVDGEHGATSAAHFTSVLFSELEPRDVARVTEWILGDRPNS